ncbi:MAG: sterol desaturase family protein [Bacteroidota bacterium]
MARNYVSNKDESARLFQSDFLEIFTHVHPTIPLAIYLPAIGYFMYTDWNLLSGFQMVLFFLAGLLFWTFTEYILHRFVFHYEPKSGWGKKLHFLMHGIHHDYPNDSLRLVMPPAVSIPLAALFYGAFVVVLGKTFTSPFFAGFLLGYLCYDMIHYATHHFAMKSSISLWVKQHHMRHHYQTDDFNYGVSSPLWDFVFGTYQEKKQTVANP